MLLPDTSNMAMSPARISFSYDLCCQSDAALPPPPEHRLSLSSSSSSTDFDFCVRRSFDQDSSSADELFSDGKILPTKIKKQRGKKPTPQYPFPFPPPQPVSSGAEETEKSKKQSSESGEVEEKQSSKSFWGFKRSSSLNCGSGYGPSLCPLPILSRSNSTGSSTSVKNKTPLSKDTPPSFKQKSPCASTYQKPPLKKIYGSQRVNPVLNVPAVNIFGLGSIFSSNPRDKSKAIKK